MSPHERETNARHGAPRRHARGLPRRGARHRPLAVWAPRSACGSASRSWAGPARLRRDLHGRLLGSRARGHRAPARHPGPARPLASGPRRARAAAPGRAWECSSRRARRARSPRSCGLSTSSRSGRSCSSPSAWRLWPGSPGAARSSPWPSSGSATSPSFQVALPDLRRPALDHAPLAASPRAGGSPPRPRSPRPRSRSTRRSPTAARANVDLKLAGTDRAGADVEEYASWAGVLPRLDLQAVVRQQLHRRRQAAHHHPGVHPAGRQLHLAPAVQLRDGGGGHPVFRLRELPPRASRSACRSSTASPPGPASPRPRRSPARRASSTTRPRSPRPPP